MLSDKQSRDLWIYFLTNHRRYYNYGGCCDCSACDDMRVEFREWFDEICVKG